MADSFQKERRGIPRIEVYAQASVAAGGVVHLMAVRNISTGGVYLEGTPEQYPDLRPGNDIEIVIFGLEDGMGDDEDLNIKCTGRIVRLDPGFTGKRPPGFGVTMQPASEADRGRLTNLLLRASGYTVGNPLR